MLEVIWIILIIFFAVVTIFTIFYTNKSIEKRLNKNVENNKNDLKYSEQGFKKIISNLYVNEEEKSVYINDKKYNFSQIVECELNEETYNSNYGKYCSKFILKITVKDISNPIEKVIINCESHIGSSIYESKKANLEKAISTIKIIKSMQNENLLEVGTVTKIEHRYITEDDAMEQIQKLSELYKTGILNEFEFETKKKELLDKVK